MFYCIPVYIVTRDGREKVLAEIVATLRAMNALELCSVRRMIDEYYRELLKDGRKRKTD